MRYIISNQLLQGGFEKPLTPGTYNGLHVLLTGTNNAGQTVGHSDFTFTINYNGQQIMRLPGAFLLEFNKQTFGFPQTTSSAGSSFNLSAIIPFSYLDVPNSIHVRPDDNITFMLEESSSVATKVASGTCYVDQIYGKSPQNYLPRLLPADRTTSGAANPRERLPYRNIATIWINGSNLSTITVEEDNEIVASATYSRLISYTSLVKFLEASAATYAEISLAGNFAEILNKDVILETQTTAADNIKIQVLSFDFSSNRRAETVLTVQRRTNQKFEKISVNDKGVEDVSEIKKIASRFAVPDSAVSPKSEL